MSLRYTIEHINKMRESAGLGVLSMGVCALSGEIVSSTPIPGSRCGGEGQDTAEYGGYLVGEGMTPAVALYLANLHNHFPAMSKAALSGPEDWEDPQGDAAYLAVIQGIAEKHGWDVFEAPLGEWIDAHLQERFGACVASYEEGNPTDATEAADDALHPASLALFRALDAFEIPEREEVRL